MLLIRRVRRKAWGRLAACADWPAASGAFGAARGPVETSGRDRLRRMGAGAGDRPGRIVARRADLGVASDAPRCPASGFFRQDVRLAPGIGGSGTNRRIRPGIRRYMAGRRARVRSAALRRRITSVALDRALFTLSSTIVTFAGIVSVAFLLPLPGKVALYAKIFRFRRSWRSCAWR